MRGFDTLEVGQTIGLAENGCGREGIARFTDSTEVGNTCILQIRGHPEARKMLQ